MRFLKCTIHLTGMARMGACIIAYQLPRMLVMSMLDWDRLQAWQQTSASPQGQQRMQVDAGSEHGGDDEAADPQLVFTRMTPCLLPELAQVSLFELS